jgi:oxygen-dependent protoporphyrinogen oxidase
LQNGSKSGPRIVIIGGGISGLAAVHRLLELSKANKSPIHLTLLEASPRLGGIIQTIHRDGFLLERGPDSFISEKPAALELARRLGIDSQLIQTNEQHRRSFIVRNGRLRPVPEGFQLMAPSRFWPFLTTDIFSLIGKLRMSADLLLPRRIANGTNDESLASFVRRRLGREALERMAQPMVGGIYTADPESLSLRATLPRFLDMEQQDRSLILSMLRKARTAKIQTGVSGPRYSLFLSFDKGMHVLVQALENAISVPNIQIRLNTKVEALERPGPTSSSWRIRTDKNEMLEAEAVCLAAPSYIAADLMSDVAPQLSSQLRKIEFASTATVNLAYRRADIAHALDGFGFVVPFIEKRALIACTFSSVKFKERAPTDHILLRAFVGGALQPEMLQLDDAEIVIRVERDLNELLGVNGKPLFVELARWNNSMPQYAVGHLDRMREIEKEVAALTGLALAGNAYFGAGIPDCIRSGEKAAEILIDQG